MVRTRPGRRRFVVVCLLALAGLAVLQRRCGGSTPQPGSSSAPIATPSRVRLDPASVVRGSVSGVVTDEAKRPVPGTLVCANGWSPEFSPAVFREVICVSADDRGAYRLDRLLPATYTVTATASSFKPAIHQPEGADMPWLELATGEQRMEIDLVLTTGGVKLSGTVADLTGGPIRGAQVSANGPHYETIATLTDSHGNFVLWVDAGDQDLRVVMEGYADGKLTVNAPITTKVVLTPASTLAGQVIDGVTGLPVAGARVQAGVETTFSEANGEFHFDRLEPGQVTLTARAEHGYGESEGVIPLGLAASVEAVTIKLQPAHQIVASVVVDSTKAHCDGATVVLHGHGRSMPLRRAGTSLIGDGLTSGDYTASIECAGHVSREQDHPIVVSGRDVAVRWEVSPGSIVRGRVFARSGKPVPGARVSASGEGRDGDVYAYSDPSGAYELGPLRSGAYVLEVNFSEQFPVTIATAVLEHDLVVEDEPEESEEPGQITGVVVDSRGRPVSNESLHLKELAGSYTREYLSSDHAGQFRLAELPPGNYRLSSTEDQREAYRARDLAAEAAVGQDVKIASGKVTTVRYVVNRESGRIRGRVVDAKGQPIGDAFVVAAHEEEIRGKRPEARIDATREAWDRVLTATDGTFELTTSSVGNYVVRAYRIDGGEAVADPVPVGSTIQLQIQPTGSISGFAHGRDGHIDDGLSISVENSTTGFSRSEHFLGTQGRFTLKAIPRGRYVVVVNSATGWKRLEATVAERSAELDIELDPFVTIVGRAIDIRTKAPIAGVSVYATSSLDRQRGPRVGTSHGTTDATGTFRVARVPPGLVELEYIAPTGVDATKVARFVAYGSNPVMVGELEVLQPRLTLGQTGGQLGFYTSDLDEQVTVWSVRDDCSAAAGGLRSGDVITSVDGIDVTRANRARFQTAVAGLPGTRVVLGLARGVTVTFTLAAPAPAPDDDGLIDI